MNRKRVAIQHAVESYWNKMKELKKITKSQFSMRMNPIGIFNLYGTCKNIPSQFSMRMNPIGIQTQTYYGNVASQFSMRMNPIGIKLKIIKK